MRRLDVAPDAQRDIDDLLAFSAGKFGESVAARYRLLISTTLNDLLADPARVGTTHHPDAPDGALLYHLRFSRMRVEARERIGRPRHLIVFRADEEWVAVFRVLDDRMDLPKRLQAIAREIARRPSF